MPSVRMITVHGKSFVLHVLEAEDKAELRDPDNGFAVVGTLRHLKRLKGRDVDNNARKIARIAVRRLKEAEKARAMGVELAPAALVPSSEMTLEIPVEEAEKKSKRRR